MSLHLLWSSIGLVALISVSALYADVKSEAPCEVPYWAAPAESNHGVFKGDLIMNCRIILNEEPGSLRLLEAGFVKKINKDSIVFKGPLSFVDSPLSSKVWDVSHTIREGGSTIVIREEAVLASHPKDQLTYQTHSKSVKADGMAGYLKSVNFFMNLKRSGDHTFQVEFRNEVTVDRPWYALDIIFAPIARGVCFDKMEQVKENILPWVTHLLEGRDVET